MNIRTRVFAVAVGATAAVAVGWPSFANGPAPVDAPIPVVGGTATTTTAPPADDPAPTPPPRPDAGTATPAPTREGPQVTTPGPPASPPKVAATPQPAEKPRAAGPSAAPSPTTAQADPAESGGGEHSALAPSAAAGPGLTAGVAPGPIDHEPPGPIVTAVALLVGGLIGAAVDRARRRMATVISARDASSADVDPSGCVTAAGRGSRNAQAIAMFAMAVVGVGLVTSWSGGSVGHYGLMAVGYLGVKMVLSARYRAHVGDGSENANSIAAIVPFYNEDPAAFERCLSSLLTQVRRPDEIWVIDDGSSDTECLRVAQRVLRDVDGVVIHRLQSNEGKRHAQAWAFSRSTADLFCTIDSDTVLDSHAIAEGIKPFADARIQAVTGNVRALNHRRNLLTKLIDLRYANAFLYERAAYSMLGSVLCACGSLSFWRSDVIRQNLNDFVSQTFLGIPVQYGDDRRLTNYALQRGKVVVQDSSIAYTVVPERMSHFVRQQLRWNKSFFRETLWVLRNFGPRAWVWWLSLAEIVTWATFSCGIFMATVVRPVVTGQFALMYYLTYMAVMSYARSTRYLGGTESSSLYQFGVFLLSPVYAAMHVVLLIPLRVWALCTIRQRGWGTRQVVEVSIDASADAAQTVDSSVALAA